MKAFAVAVLVVLTVGAAGKPRKCVRPPVPPTIERVSVGSLLDGADIQGKTVIVTSGAVVSVYRAKDGCVEIALAAILPPDDMIHPDYLPEDGKPTLFVLRCTGEGMEKVEVGTYAWIKGKVTGKNRWGVEMQSCSVDRVFK